MVGSGKPVNFGCAPGMGQFTFPGGVSVLASRRRRAGRAQAGFVNSLAPPK